MTYILKHSCQLRAISLVTLIRYFITHTPNYNTWIISVVMNKIYNILLCPLIKYLMIAILTFCTLPFVERFCHNHHTHLIASLNKFRSRHIMRSTYGINTHILHYLYLTTDSSLIYCSTQRT